ncbi:transglutaminase-like domain-containing protein [Myxococcota bacterium]|nr:transglutaminase-like domain-containing protein [Myxococcota bacterium]
MVMRGGSAARAFGRVHEPEVESRPKRGTLSALVRSPARLVHAALLATALAIFAWPITLPTGLAAGALGAALGTFVAELLVGRRYRVLAIVGFAILWLVAGRVTVEVLSDAEWISALASPVLVLVVAEVIRWGAVGLGASVVLRSIALRYRAALAIEGGVVVAAVVTTVAAHRDGMIARPLTISDWFWSQGVDPVVAFLAIGVAGALLLAGILAHGRSPKRTVAQLAFVFFLGLFLAAFIHGTDLDTPKKNPAGQELDAKADDKRGGGDGGQGAQGGQGGKGDQKGDGRSGFRRDDLPSAGQSGKNQPAAIVVFHKDVTPAAGVFYFRHAVFSQFNGTRLIEATRPDVDPDAVRSFPTARQPIVGPSEGAIGREIVATDVALLTEHQRMFTLTDAIEVEPMPNPEPARFRRAYRVVSSVVTDGFDELLGVEPGESGWSDEVWDHYTEVPKDERYHELAARLRAQLRAEYARDPVAMAVTVKRYLEENATYSFVRNYEGSDDPTAEFLFSEDKKGYCVHLAHAAAYLLRAMGVPARVSAGYAVPAQNLGAGSSLLIKSGDAHAWAEVYLRTVGWVPVEVTPEKTDVQPSPFQEKDLQQMLGEMARKEGRESRSQPEVPKILEALKKLLAMIPWMLAALVAAAYAWKTWRLVAPAFVRGERRARLAYRAALDRLSAVGFLRARGEPRERFAKRLQSETPSFVPLTATHVGVAFGSRDALRSLDTGASGSLTALARKVGTEARRAVPWWRWLLGLLNPISWWWSR